MKRNFRGIWIPREVYLDADLSWSEKILLVEIDSLSNNGECFAKNKYFAEFLGQTTQSISRSISKLKVLGYIDKYAYKDGKRLMGATILVDRESPLEALKIDDRGRFDTFWSLYNKKIGKTTCQKIWDKLTDKERNDIVRVVPVYIKNTPELKYRKHPASWLRQRGWEDDYSGISGGLQSGNNKGMVL